MNIFENGHMTDNAILALLTGALDDNDSIAAAEHISACEECAARLAADSGPFEISAPIGFTDKVSDRIASLAAEKRRDYLLYSARVAMCAAAAIAVIMSGVFGPPERVSAAPAAVNIPEPVITETPSPDELRPWWQRFENSLEELSEKIKLNVFNKENQTDDQTKK